MVPNLQADRALFLTAVATSAARTGFWSYRRFTRVGRIVTLAVLSFAAVGEVAIRMTGDDRPFIASVFSLATTATFLLFLWRPPIAAIALILLGIPGFAVHETGGYLIALAAAFGIVVYSCSVGMAVLFGSAVLTWLAIYTATEPDIQAGGVMAYVVLAFMSAAIGYVLRRLIDRTATMRTALDRQDERLAEELRAERTRIADELHDIVAHDIAIVAMHARVLQLAEDDETRRGAQQAIADSAGQALAEARRILHVVHGGADGPHSEPSSPVDLPAALNASADELRALGADVTVTIAEGPRTARSIDATLVRTCREAVTNIMKHGSPPGPVTIDLTYPRERVRLSVRSVLPAQPRTTLPSSGYGIPRLRERAIILGGSLRAERSGNAWVTEITLPRD